MTRCSSTEDWYAAWNGRDVQAILSLYGDQLTFASPFVKVLGMADGVLRSKAEFEHYLRTALPRAPNLRFEPIADCVGVLGRTLVYRNQAGATVAETHSYDDEGLIAQANAAYDPSPDLGGFRRAH